MSVFDAVIQGIIQGLTEFLPVSSSGHLSVWQHFCGEGGETAGIYSILLHLGTLLAVLIAFRGEVCAMCAEFFKMLGEIFFGRFDKSCAEPARRRIFLLIISLLPLCGFYFLTDFYTSLAADNDIIVEGVCFLLTAALLLVSSRCVKAGGRTAESMTWKDALAMGIMQGIAPLPGLSRSGSTIAGGVFFGLDRKFLARFSFLMSIPAILGAFCWDVLKLILKRGEPAAVAITPLPIIIGTVTAFIVGYAAIKWMLKLISDKSFKPFAVYVFVLGFLVCLDKFVTHIVF